MTARKNGHAVALGRLGGSVRSARKTLAAQANARRPRPKARKPRPADSLK